MLVKNQPTPQYPPISDFYAGKTVALTGGTGFLGQGIVEKLLYSCPDVKKIILLIRSRRGATPEDRLKSLADKPCFDRVRKVYPNFMDKLAFVSCDLEAKDLGLSRQSKRLLRNEVNVFIHCAATLKFNEIIRIAFEMNVQCTRRIVKLLTRCRHLESFVHVSTAFVNSHNHCDVIEEKIYRRKVDYRNFEKSLKFMNDEQLAGMLPQLLDGLPNTYTLTKAWAEEAVLEECGEIPCCIVRPGMITPSLAEPREGWITNVYGPTAFVAANLKGICKLANADNEINADLVPVDFVVNGCIVAAVKTAVDAKNKQRSKLGLRLGLQSSSMDEINSEGYSSHESTSSEESDFSVSSESLVAERVVEKPKQVPCYHITTCAQNPFPIQHIVDGLQIWGKKEPADMIAPHNTSVTYNKKLYEVRSFFKEYIPSFIVDILARLTGQTPRAVMIYKKLRAGMEVMEPFFMYCHDFQWKKSKNLLMSLNKEDQKTFNFDPNSFTWEEYMRLYCRGARKFILREKTTDEQNKTKQFIVGTFFHCLGVTREVCFSAMTSSIGYTSCLWDNTSYYYI